MSSSATAVQSLQIPDSWKIAACYVPVLGDIVSNFCQTNLSYRIAGTYGNENRTEKKFDKNVLELLKLQREYMGADNARHGLSIGISGMTFASLIIGTAMKVLSVATLFKSLLFVALFAVISFSRAEAASAKRTENHALADALEINGLVTK